MDCSFAAGLCPGDDVIPHSCQGRKYEKTNVGMVRETYLPATIYRVDNRPNGSVEVSVGVRKSIVFIAAISESYYERDTSPERPGGRRSVWQNENGALPGN
jgi:hypothetical protein